MSLDVAAPASGVKAGGRPSPSAALVVAVVVGANSGRWLDPCFATLLRSDHGNLRAVYVDNASTDGSADFIRARFSEVDVVEACGNVGFARGSNIGIERALRAGADQVLLLNPDTRTPPGLVRRLAGFMAAHPAYAIVGPLQWGYGTTQLNAWSRHALDNGERSAFCHWDPTLPSDAGPTAGRAPCTLEHAYVQGAALRGPNRMGLGFV